MKRLLGSLILLLPAAAWGQISYVAQKTTSLSGAAEVITVQQQQSPSNNRFVDFKTAYVGCSVACTVTIERNGTTATSTTLSPLPVNPGETAATVTAWSSSNVGVGSVIQRADIPAAGFLVFDLTGINLKTQAGNGSNFTIRSTSITGTINITINWTER